MAITLWESSWKSKEAKKRALAASPTAQRCASLHCGLVNARSDAYEYVINAKIRNQLEWR
jgi:hypothetical protein